MSSARPSRLRRWGLRVLYLLVACVILWLGARLWLGAVAGDRVARELAEIHAAGEPRTISEAAPPEIPEAENAAVLLQAAFDQLQEEPEDVIAAWGDFEDDPFAVESKAVDLFSTWVASNEAALAIAAGALDRPQCRFARSWTSARDMEFKEIAGKQGLSRLWKSRALLRAREGDFDGALEDCGRMVRLGTLASQHPLLIDLLVGMGLADVGATTSQEILRRGRAGKTALETVLRVVEKAPRGSRVRQAALLERAYVNSAYDEAVEDPSQIGRYLPLEDIRSFPQSVAAWLLPTAMLRLDQARFLKLYGDAVALMDRPYRETRPEWLAFGEAVRDEPWYASMSTGVCRLYPLIAWKAAQHAARMDLLALALRIESYLLNTGALPEALDALGLATMPRDRFRDAPYVYRRLPDDGFLLYSVGPNGVDDDGVDGGDDIETKGDLTWRR